ESVASSGAHLQFVAFDGHQDSASGTDGFDREIHDEWEQLVERAMSGQLAARADQGAHLRAALHHVGLVKVLHLRTEDCVEAGYNGGGRVRKALAMFDEDDGV